MLTRCPNCKTLYDIDDQVLAASDYSAICCRCHHVFHTEPETAPDEDESILLPEPEPTSSLLREESRFADTDLTHQIDRLGEFDDDWDEIDESVEQQQDAVADEAAQPIPNLVVDAPVAASADWLSPDAATTAAPSVKKTPVWTLVTIFLLSLTAVGQWYMMMQPPASAAKQVSQRLACVLLDCPKPVQSDVSQFKVLERTLAAAKQPKGALELKLAFTNEAKFAQLYPILELSFLNTQDKLLAQRGFEPNDYLFPTSANGQLMAPGEIAKVSLVLRDPGLQSTGYKLDFLEFEKPSAIVH